VAVVFERGGIAMDWQKILINWEAPLFWSVLGLIGGVIVAHYYYKKTGADLKALGDAIFDKIETSVGISEEAKEALKANMAGIFYTHPWEKDFLPNPLPGRVERME
jgi:hypothetical protein